jgi:hypothetical protein
LNERIKELWSQAGGHYNSGNQHTWPEYTIDDPEKFAELIIEQCIQAVKNVGGYNEDYHMNAIKKYFGVEE